MFNTSASEHQLIALRIDFSAFNQRVSILFAGQRNLIQGSSTYLPPGYQIERGADNDPQTIRVTTPR
jgi:paired amphipathic helix protein Sin3a